MADTSLGGDSSPANVIPFPAPKPRLRTDVPPFDPNNPRHLRAWEAMWDLAVYSVASREGSRHG